MDEFNFHDYWLNQGIDQAVAETSEEEFEFAQEPRTEVPTLITRDDFRYSSNNNWEGRKDDFLYY